jgi:hypothetical protein
MVLPPYIYRILHQACPRGTKESYIGGIFHHCIMLLSYVTLNLFSSLDSTASPFIIQRICLNCTIFLGMHTFYNF